MLGGEAVQLDRQPAQLLERLAVAEDLGGAVEAHVLVVVAHVGLGGRREDRLRKLLGLLQPLRQLDPAHGAGGLVVLPARAGDVPAHDALDREHLEALDEHRATADLLGHPFGVGDDVVRHDVAGPVEPEGRDAGQDLALSGDGRGVDRVVGGDAIRRHHQQSVALVVDLADLARRKQLVALERGGCAHGSNIDRGEVVTAGARTPEAG